MSANIYLSIGVFLMVFAVCCISRLYNKEQKDYNKDIGKNDETNYSDSSSIITDEMRKQMAAIFYIAAFCVPVITISISASIIGNSQIAIGVIIGGNITLLLLCRGVSYMTKNIRRIMNGDIMFLAVVSVILLFLANDTMFNRENSINLISKTDGIIILIFGIIYIILKKLKNKLPQNLDKSNQKEDCKQNAQSDVDKINKKNILQNIRYKGRLVIYIAINIAGAIIYVWNITETSIYLYMGQNKTSTLISGTILMVLLIMAYYIIKNVDSVEKIVDNNGLVVQLTQKNVDKNESLVKIAQKNVDNKKFYLRREMENADKIEETSIILIGIIEMSFVVGVSSIIQNIQVPLSLIKNIVFICAIYILYCLMSNLPNRWDRIKGSIMVTCFIAYVVYGFMYT